MSHPQYDHGESQSDRLARKAKDAPFMIAGEYCVVLLIYKVLNEVDG